MNLPDFLTEWPRGEVVLTEHRIGLYSVIDAHQRGMTPAQIHEEYPTRAPELIEKVLTFHRESQAAVDAYVAEYRAELDRQEAAYQPKVSLEELRRRYEAGSERRRPD